MQQPPSAYQYTTSVDINNTRYKRIQSLIDNHMRHVRIEFHSGALPGVCNCTGIAKCSL